MKQRDSRSSQIMLLSSREVISIDLPAESKFPYVQGQSGSGLDQFICFGYAVKIEITYSKIAIPPLWFLSMTLVNDPE